MCIASHFAHTGLGGIHNQVQLSYEQQLKMLGNHPTGLYLEHSLSAIREHSLTGAGLLKSTGQYIYIVVPVSHTNQIGVWCDPPNRNRLFPACNLTYSKPENEILIRML